MDKLVFELIVVDTLGDVLEYDRTTIEADHSYIAFVGEGLCGLQFRGHRPNKLTRLHMPLTASGKLWEARVLIPTMSKDYVDNESST